VRNLRSGNVVYARNPERNLKPASTLKLVTTAAALDALGPDARIRTTVETAGRLDGLGRILGDVYLVGRGDPNLSGRFADGRPTAIFEDMAEALRQQGVRRIEGRVIGQEGLFSGDRRGDDWSWGDLVWGYGAEVSALSFNDNCVLVRVWPRQKSGLVRVETVPPVHIFQVTNSAVTTNSRRHNHRTVQRREDRLIVTGTIGRDSGPLEVWVTVHDPVRYFGMAMVGALAEEGIEVQGRLRPVRRLPGPARS